MASLDKFTKIMIRQGLRERQRLEMIRLADEGKRLLIETATRLILAQWADKQEDMKVLQRYNLAAPVKAANFGVYNPTSKLYDIRFGVELSMDLLTPDRGYWSGYVKADDESHAGCLALHDLRISYEVANLAERNQLDADLRATTSLVKIKAQYPWIGEGAAHG